MLHTYNDHEKARSLDCNPWFSCGRGRRERAAGAASGAAALRRQDDAPAQADRQGAIVRNVNLVEVLFSVVTKHEKLVTDLNKENFKVFDDGVAAGNY